MSGGLPWVRIDGAIASHDKMLMLLSDRSQCKWQAAASYMFAIGWCGINGTDGRVPRAALGYVHGTRTTAGLLVKYRLWEANEGGWQIVNFLERQQGTAVSEVVRAAKSAGGTKGNCVRWHGPDCGCWKVSVERP